MGRGSYGAFLLIFVLLNIESNSILVERRLSDRSMAVSGSFHGRIVNLSRG